MWLKLTTVSFHGTGKKQTSMVRELRINMDRIEVYFEAPEDMKNNVSEQARCNTILMVAGDTDKAYHAKETVEEIDEMVAAYGCETEVLPKLETNVSLAQVGSKGGWGTFKG